MREQVRERIHRLIDEGVVTHAEAPFLEAAATDLLAAAPGPEVGIVLAIVTQAVLFSNLWAAQRQKDEAERRYEEVFGHPPLPDRRDNTRTARLAKEAELLPRTLADDVRVFRVLLENKELLRGSRFYCSMDSLLRAAAEFRSWHPRAGPRRIRLRASAQPVPNGEKRSGNT
jgi:hypothetical protein